LIYGKTPITDIKDVYENLIHSKSYGYLAPLCKLFSHCRQPGKGCCRMEKRRSGEKSNFSNLHKKIKVI